MKRIDRYKILPQNSDTQFAAVTADFNNIYISDKAKSKIYRCSSNGVPISAHKSPEIFEQLVFASKTNNFFAVHSSHKNMLFKLSNKLEESQNFILPLKYHSTYPITNLEYNEVDNCLVFSKGFFEFNYFPKTDVIKSTRRLPVFHHISLTVSRKNYIVTYQNLDTVYVLLDGYVICEFSLFSHRIIDMSAIPKNSNDTEIVAITSDSQNDYHLFIIKE